MCRISPWPSISTSCPGGTAVELGGSSCFARLVPDRPQRAVLRTQTPQGKCVDAQRLRGPHLVQRGYAVEKPHIVTNVVLVEVGDVRIHRVAVELHIGFGLFGFEPRILHRDVVDGLGRRALLLAGFLRPVVTVVADCRDDLLARYDRQRILQVLHEPVLTGDGSGHPARVVLVIVHQDEAVGDLRNGAVVELLVVHRNGDVELESPGLQVAVQLLHELSCSRRAKSLERPQCRA